MGVTVAEASDPSLDRSGFKFFIIRLLASAFESGFKPLILLLNLLVLYISTGNKFNPYP